MGYKSVDDRKAASRRHYIQNKADYLQRNKDYRKDINLFVRNLKESKSCLDCNKYYPYYVMDFDHLQHKDFNINYLMSTGRIGALKKEIEKCELVCSNCHRERSHKRLSTIE